jgi:hypothetical protein
VYERLLATSPAPRQVPEPPRHAELQQPRRPVALAHRLAAMRPEPLPIQRQVEWDKKTKALVKADREAFASDTQREIGVGANEARCHFIPYEVIVAGVMDPINECVKKGWSDVALGALDGIVAAIFPNGGAATSHQGQQNANALDTLASKYYRSATRAVDDVDAAFTNRDPVALEDAAKRLVTSLNNSPDNLRPGWSGTNSSIQSGLDFIQNRAKSTLPTNAVIVDADGNPTMTTPPSTVIFVDAQHEQQLETLLTRTYSKKGVVHAFSSGTNVQSSDNKGQKTSTMVSSNPTPIAISFGKTKQGHPKFFLFDV